MADVVYDSCHVLVLSASLREESLNTRLARLAAETIEAGGHVAELATMREFDVVPYDADEEHAVGFPAGAEELRAAPRADDAFVIVSPEYNASMPGVLKNAIDWVSAVPAAAVQRAARPAAVRVAVDGRRQPRALGAARPARAPRRARSIRTCSRSRRPMRPSTAIASRTRACRSASRRRSRASFASPRRRSTTRALKTAWVEFLGERPEPLIDRVE